MSRKTGVSITIDEKTKSAWQPLSEQKTPRSIRKDTGLLISRSRGGVPKRGDFSSIKEQLLASGDLWCDPDFPADVESLSFCSDRRTDIEWKRPHELCSKPKFIEDGATRFDVQQGELGDCWFLAAVAALAMHQELLNNVVPPDQTFKKGSYCGVFRFRFWRFGEWKEVLVDDRLPSAHGRLIFMRSVEQDEFWSALLEKAYAKLVGSYEAMRGGSAGEAMEDFTGGINEFYNLMEERPDNLFDILLKANCRSSLLSCGIDPNPRMVEARLANGLIMGHSYTITDVRRVRQTALIRMRNPWGNEVEWNGAWSDGSDEWKAIPKAERKELGLTFEDDGEFWMSYEDFIRNFQSVEICHLGPDSLAEDQLGGKARRRWECLVENGEWSRRVNAGGCRNFPTFWTNPQYRVEVVDPDEDDDDDMGTIIVGLMQKNMRKKKKEGVELHQIGYAIYRLKEPQLKDNRRLEMKFFKTNLSTAKSKSFINRREVCYRHKLPSGHYCIVPSTFEPEMEAEFLLRIFSERPNNSGEMDDTTGVEQVKRESVVSVTPTTSVDGQSALQVAFDQAAGEDGELDAEELRDILNANFPCSDSFRFSGFSLETCRSMVSLLDYDQSGSLGFDEFQALWKLLSRCKAAFVKYDEDKSGTFNCYELRSALNAVGYKVSNKVFHSLVMRFSNKKGIIYFDDFVSCCFRLKTIFETFEAQTKDSGRSATFNSDQFFQCIVYI